MNISSQVIELVQKAKDVSTKLSSITTAKKNAVLNRVADLLPQSEDVLRANEKDQKNANKNKLKDSLFDRLVLDRSRLRSIAQGLREVADLPDPVGTITYEHVLKNGLRVQRMRVPLGVIGIIYESRPNVTADAAALCLKSGNVSILRGGKEAFHSNMSIAHLFEIALDAENLPLAAITFLPMVEREAISTLLKLDNLIDVLIPRGGEGLIRFVSEHSKIPVLRHYKGVCHIYVADDANSDDALRIIRNAKVQRPGVCNAVETLLVDKNIAHSFLPRLVANIGTEVELRGDKEAVALVPTLKTADSTDWDTEYLELILAIRIVDGFEQALEHIALHGTHHTESILTTDAQKARRWVREVDASLVLVNASTRFNDGHQLGLGAEIGISTTKLHAYGPMGLNELCAQKWVAYGEGQIRT